MGAQPSHDALSKDDLEFLKSNTNYDEQTICDFYKGFLSDCPAGKLRPDTFCQIYSKCFPTGNAKEFCDHVFRTFDTDKNGVIDFKEFLLSIDVNCSGTAEEKLSWAFRYCKYFVLYMLPFGKHYLIFHATLFLATFPECANTNWKKIGKTQKRLQQYKTFLPMRKVSQMLSCKLVHTSI